MKSISIPIFLLFLYISIGNCQQAQIIRFWNASGCAGDYLWQQTGASGSFRVPVRPSLGFTVNGLWSTRSCNSSSFCDNPIIRQPSGTCQTFVLLPNTTTVNVTRYGDANQVERRIHLYPAANLQGIPEIVDERSITFASPRSFSSYFFTGKNSWELLNERGNRISCLNHTITGPNDYGMRYALSTTLTNVKRVVFGCGNGTTITTTTTTTKKPGSGNSGNALERSIKSLFLGFLAVAYFQI